MKKKILHILNSSSYSGAENVVITIIMNMHNKYECAYVSMDGMIRKILEENNVTFFPISKTSISEVRRIIKLYQPDIIQAHDFTASIICTLSTKKIPIISHLHNNPPWIKTYHPYSFIYLFCALKCKKILGVSSAIFEEYIFRNQLKSKTIVVSNPIDISTIQRKAKVSSSDIHSYDILYIGRFSVQKNPQRFIRIIYEVVKVLPNIKVAMIGTGQLLTECSMMIQNHKLNDVISLLGFVKNPYAVLIKSKILCITSDWEGFGLVAIEALSLGVPVLATSVGGLPGIVNEKCGLLCKNDLEFIDEIKGLLSNETYWQAKSIQATLRANEIENIDTYINDIDKIYSEILQY